MLRYAGAVFVATVMGSSLSGVPPAPPRAGEQAGIVFGIPACDPSAAPTDEQVARRRLAISAARQITTAEGRTFAATKRYAPLAELTDVLIPQGFEAHVSTDGTTYTFSIKDLRDTCRFAVFSDQKGLIYTATALQ